MKEQNEVEVGKMEETDGEIDDDGYEAQGEECVVDRDETEGNKV